MKRKDSWSLVRYSITALDDEENILTDDQGREEQDMTGQDARSVDNCTLGLDGAIFLCLSL